MIADKNRMNANEVRMTEIDDLNRNENVLNRNEDRTNRGERFLGYDD